MRLLWRLALLVLVVLVANVPAQVTNRYGVASGGLTTGTCTVDTPSVTNGQCTIARLMTQLVAGNVGLLHGGTYTAGNLGFTNAGTSTSNLITLKPFGDGTVTISHAVAGQACFNIQGATKRFYRVEDIICDGGDVGADGVDFQDGASDITLVRVTAKNTKGNGFFATGNVAAYANITLIDCIGDRNDPSDLTTGLVHGIYFSSGVNTATNLTVRGGRFSRSGGRGIQIINSAFTQRLFNVVVEGVTIEGNNDGMVISMTNGLTVRNNLIYRNNRAGSGAKGGLLVGECAGTIDIYNNTIVNNPGGGSSPLPGLYIRSNCSTANVKNNIVQGNGAGNCAGDVCSGSGFSNNAFGGTGVAFVNAAIDDYRLQATDTVARNQGATIASVTVDIAGVPRPQQGVYDIGAYEYQATTTPSLARAPATLTSTAPLGSSNPPPQSITITNTQAGTTMPWTVADTPDVPWLACSPASGTNDATTSCTVTNSGLATGVYTATVTITATGATNSPQTVGVTHTVTPATAPAAGHQGGRIR